MPASVDREKGLSEHESKRLQAELTSRGVRFIPTVANFILVRTALPAVDLYQRLLSRGVIVRPMGAYGYPDGVRVSVGTEFENRRFLEALDDSLRDAGSRVPSSA